MGGRRRGVYSFASSVSVIVLVVLCLSITLMSAGAVSAAAVYPEATGNVNDFVGVLGEADKANLEALIDSVLKQTGTTFAVAIVKDHGDESIEMYAANLYEKWGIGKKGEDKGLLIVVSMAEHGLKAEVGYGLEPVITDARAGDCLDKMLPYFKENEYGKGLYAGLLLAAQYIAKDQGVALDVKPATKDYESLAHPFPIAIPGGLLAAVAALVALPIAAVAFFAIRGARCPNCKSKIVVTDKVIQAATYSVGGMAMKVYQCPRCGYRKEIPYRTRPLMRPLTGGGFPTGGGPFFGGGFGGRGGGGFSGPKGFGGGRSGGGGASRKW